MTEIAQRFDLNWLLHPLEPEVFTQQYWATKPLRLQRSERSFFELLLSEQELVNALHAASRLPGAVQILRSENAARPAGSHGAAMAALGSGASLRINGIQHYVGAVGRLVRNLEQCLALPVNVNMYLTPGGGKALQRHYDTHDVFVAQISGAKKWRLYGPDFPVPLEYLPTIQQEGPGYGTSRRLKNNQNDGASRTLQEEFTLNAGDLLYLPRGVWHEAQSPRSEVSCHLTIGVQTRSYLDMVTMALSAAANKSPELRTSLPLGGHYTDDQYVQIEKQLRQGVQQMVESLDARHLMSMLRESFDHHRMSSYSERLLGTAGRDDALQIGGDVEVQLRDGSAATLSEGDEKLQLGFHGKRFFLPPPYREALRSLLLGARYSARTMPGRIAESDKLLLIRQLFSNGLLVRTCPEQPERVETLSEPVWYPTAIDVGNDSVHWFDFEERPVSEPFFHQTVTSLVRERPWVRKRHTALSRLASREADSVQQPAGFIFHVSRCGSTLVANALRAFEGVTVLSEPGPVSTVLDLLREGSADPLLPPAEALLLGLVGAYVEARQSSPCIIKFTSWNILHARTISQLWPGVPMMIIVRDPLEVAVSCVKNPPGWFSRLPQIVAGRSQQSKIVPSGRSNHEQNVAQAIGSFLEAAEQIGQASRVLDYSELTPDSIVEVGRFFQLTNCSLNRAALHDAFVHYSKDPTGVKAFASDTEKKQHAADAALREAVDMWSRGPYGVLREPFRSIVSQPTASSDARPPRQDSRDVPIGSDLISIAGM